MTNPLPPSGPTPGESFFRNLIISVLKWGGLGVALLLTAGLSGYFSMRKAVRGGEVLVPALQGKSLADASGLLRAVGLVLEKSGERSDEQFSAGQILVQDPPGGARLKRNRKVRVVVSLGKEVLRVPRLLGQPARRAQIALEQSGLETGEVSYTYSAQTSGDRVLAQEPPPGAPRMREGKVDLLVSKGTRPKVWVMPQVEGREIGAVTRIFAEAGIHVGSIRRESVPGVVPGIVVRQYPLAGYPLREGDSINLVVSEAGEESG